MQYSTVRRVKYAMWMSTYTGIVTHHHTQYEFWDGMKFMDSMRILGWDVGCVSTLHCMIEG